MKFQLYGFDKQSALNPTNELPFTTSPTLTTPTTPSTTSETSTTTSTTTSQLPSTTTISTTISNAYKFVETQTRPIATTLTSTILDSNLPFPSVETVSFQRYSVNKSYLRRLLNSQITQLLIN